MRAGKGARKGLDAVSKVYCCERLSMIQLKLGDSVEVRRCAIEQILISGSSDASPEQTRVERRREARGNMYNLNHSLCPLRSAVIFAISLPMNSAF